MFIDTEIRAFGDSIGIKNLCFNEKGCLKLIFENNENIHIEKNNDTIFFFVLKNYVLAPLPLKIYQRALTVCKNQRGFHHEIRAIAQSDNDIGFLTTLSDNECDQPTLYKLFKFLLQLVETLPEV